MPPFWPNTVLILLTHSRQNPLTAIFAPMSAGRVSLVEPASRKAGINEYQLLPFFSRRPYPPTGRQVSINQYFSRRLYFYLISTIFLQYPPISNIYKYPIPKKRDKLSTRIYNILIGFWELNEVFSNRNTPSNRAVEDR